MWQKYNSVLGSTFSQYIEVLMNHRLLVSAALFSLIAAPALADQEDDLVRLPGQGEVKKERIAEVGAERLAPGGGLMASFDADLNGRVSLEELEAGIRDAFVAADTNGDGELTPLEQQDWANNLPTRDESLLNPARFDPNLDFMVSVEEFSEVIHAMAAGYSEKDSDEVVLASLKRDPKQKKDELDPDEVRERLGLPDGERNRRNRF